MRGMRPVDHLVLASYCSPRKYVVMFVDGVELKVWASNPGQARIIGKLRRVADGRGSQYISHVVEDER